METLPNTCVQNSRYSGTNLSSPESAYSTGYSTDGTSPGAPPEYYINIKTGRASSLLQDTRTRLNFQVSPSNNFELIQLSLIVLFFSGLSVYCIINNEAFNIQITL